MSALERIEYLLDEGSFIEIGLFTRKKGTGVITGYGTINKQLVYIYSEDHLLKGGMMNGADCKKISEIMEMALKMGAPIIQIFDSIGGKINEGMELLSEYGRLLKLHSKLSGVVPQISVICGPCTGAEALCASMSDIVIMTANGRLYVNPSETIEQINGTYSPYDLYAVPKMSIQNGTVQFQGENEEEAFGLVKRIMSYLPQNNTEIPSFTEGSIKYSGSNIDELYISKKLKYDNILLEIADEDSILEIGAGYAPYLRTTFIKLGGMAVGVIGTDGEKGVTLGRTECEKALRFVKLCNAFNISILSLADCRGFTPDISEERGGLSLYAAKLVYALSEANVPKVALIIGQCIGMGYIALASKETSFDMVFALEGAIICVGEPSNVIKTLYRQEIISADKPMEKEQELLNLFLEKEASALKAAEDGYIDDLIKPSEAKIKLIKALDMLQSKREIKYPKKHGSVSI